MTGQNMSSNVSGMVGTIIAAAAVESEAKHLTKLRASMLVQQRKAKITNEKKKLQKKSDLETKKANPKTEDTRSVKSSSGYYTRSTDNNNNTNVKKAVVEQNEPVDAAEPVIKPDPATSIVPVKPEDIISLFGEDKKPWYGIVHKIEQEQMQVTYLESKDGRRVLFTKGETAMVPRDSLICVVTATRAADDKVIIKEVEQKRVRIVQAKIDQHIENPALENRQRYANWEFPSQYVKENFDDLETQKLVLRAMAKDLVILCLHRNLDKFGFHNKQHWAKSKDGNGATMFPFLLLTRLMTMSLERGNWQRVTVGDIKWQATVNLANVNYRNVAICGGMAGPTWEASLKVLMDLGFILPMEKFNGQVAITITLPPFQLSQHSPVVVDLTTAMLEELN